MVFEKKKTKEDIVDEIPIVESPKAEEIKIEEDIEEEATEAEDKSPLVTGEQLDNELSIILGQIQNRITNVEATLYRLMNR